MPGKSDRASQAAQSGPFVTSRTFDAPRSLVWKAHSELDRLKQWWGPKGFPVVSATLDFRPGGAFHYCLRSESGRQEMWGRLTYREIVAPERIVAVVSFTDAKGNIVRNPMSPTWPLETLSTMTLTEANGRTTVTIGWHAINATAEEIKTFDLGKPGMEQGLAATLKQLAEHLAQA